MNTIEQLVQNNLDELAMQYVLVGRAKSGPDYDEQQQNDLMDLMMANFGMMEIYASVCRAREIANMVGA